MKRKLFVLLLALACLLTLAACGCEHQWADADCEKPRTCTLCGATEGEALGHDWAEADCGTPRTCSLCGKTEGEALGHDWAEADCGTPKTCTRCGATEGEALGHAWEDATTEAPKTCSRCGKTEGEPIDADPRFSTAACKDWFGTWEGVFNMTADMMGLDGFEGTIDVTMTLHFSNDGVFTPHMQLTDKEATRNKLAQFYEDMAYAQFAAEGFTPAQADEAFMATEGMTVKEFAKLAASMIDFDAMFEASMGEYAYYVEDGQLYTAESWDAEFDQDQGATLDGDTMHLVENGMDVELKRVGD